MSCQECGSDRIASISAKCSDLFSVSIGIAEHDGYVPRDMNIGGGDYMEIDLCLDCGHVQGNWPLPATKLEKIHEPAKTSEWACDPRYLGYVDGLLRFARANWNSGINPVLPMLFGEDDDPDRIIAGAAALMQDPLTNLLAKGLVNAMDDWEHADRLYKVLAVVDPKNYGDEEDEDW